MVFEQMIDEIKTQMHDTNKNPAGLPEIAKGFLSRSLVPIYVFLCGYQYIYNEESEKKSLKILKECNIDII